MKKFVMINVNLKLKFDVNTPDNVISIFDITLFVNDNKKLRNKVELTHINNFHEFWIWALNWNEWMNVEFYIRN